MPLGEEDLVNFVLTSCLHDIMITHMSRYIGTCRIAAGDLPVDAQTRGVT